MENLLVIYDAEIGEITKMKVGDKAKIRTQEEKGGPELLASLQQGMYVQIKFNNRLGLVKKVKVMPPE